MCLNLFTFSLLLLFNSLIELSIGTYMCSNNVHPKYKLMILTVLLLALLSLSSCKPNNAPYIHQVGRPLNIAHRGLCSILPENTL